MVTGKNSNTKKVGDNIVALRSNWNFGGNVADSFLQHVKRSVPLYDVGHDLVCKISDFFVQKESLCYEIGASTGELTAKLSNYNGHKPGVRWVGMDLEEGMVKKARKHCEDLSNVEILAEDVNSFEFEKSDFIVAYYCVQFIKPHQRQAIFNKIFESLNWGGAFVMFEKVRAPDARFQDISTALYNDYKQGQGYSDEEIMEKSRSLRGALEPYTAAANVAYLNRAGFVDVMSVMKYVCFEGWLAIK